MSVVVVTLSSTVTATPTSASQSSSISSGTVAGIVIGTLLGGVLFISLTLYLLHRYTRHKFTQVANHAHDDPEGAHLSSSRSRRSKLFGGHSQRPSISSEPLMSPASWPPIPATSRILSPGTPPRLDPIHLDRHDSSFDLDEIHRVITSDSTIPAQSASPASSWRGLGDTPPLTRQTSRDGEGSPSTPTKSLFLHRMLKTRAQASEGVAPARRPSLDLSQSRSTTLDSSDARGDEERLLAEAERTALRDAAAAEKEGLVAVKEGEEDWEEVESTESIYSQSSATVDHAGLLLGSTSGQNGSSATRRKSSRRRPRAPGPTELAPVTEVPDTPSTVSHHISTAANPSLDAQGSGGTADQPGGALPLLTSTNFGKGSATSGSISTAGWGSGSGSGSSGSASRYPSLAPSSIGMSSRSGPRSDGDTDWHHPPSGLAGLASLQMVPLQNPHSPVEEQPKHADVLAADPARIQRAHLREGTVSSLPEVERRDVMQSGIVHIDVAL